MLLCASVANSQCIAAWVVEGKEASNFHFYWAVGPLPHAGPFSGLLEEKVWDASGLPFPWCHGARNPIRDSWGRKLNGWPNGRCTNVPWITPLNNVTYCAAERSRRPPRGKYICVKTRTQSLPQDRGGNATAWLLDGSSPTAPSRSQAVSESAQESCP